MYTVKQLSDMARISIRTLHYYDQIGLLRPDSVGENGYRYYGDPALLRLQQILFFKELGFSLEQITEIVQAGDFDVLRALQSHRSALEERVGRLNLLICTVDKTILHLKGNLEMSQKEFYEGFNEEKQKKYREEIRHKYGEEPLGESERRWGSYSADEKKQIIARGEAIFQRITGLMPQGFDDPDVQKEIAALHSQMNYFYECSLEIFEGLGHMYNENPEFIAMYRSNYHLDLPPFLEKAVIYYCQQKRLAK